MIKPCGPICNLACDYCYYLPKAQLYPGSDFRMSYPLLEEVTYQVIDSQPGSQVTFIWQGGEPTLMGIEFFQEALRLQNKYAKPNQKITNTLQTNGTLLNRAWCHFFRDNNFLIGLSLDGRTEFHNSYRHDKLRQGQFVTIMHAVHLLNEYQLNYNILCCVHQANVNCPSDVYRFLRDTVKTQYIQFIPILQRKIDERGQELPILCEPSINASSYGQFMIEIFDEWIQKDVGHVFIQHFDVALGTYLGYPPNLCVFAKTCGRSLVLEHNGDVYKCDHFVNQNDLLGNINQSPLVDLVDSQKQHEFGNRKFTLLPQTCMDCEVRFLCNGGCPKNRDKSGKNILCEGYRSFFKHIAPSMAKMTKLMLQGHSPAEIMSSIL